MPCEAQWKKMAPGGTRSESLQLAPGPGGWTNWTNRRIPCCLQFGDLSLWTFLDKNTRNTSISVDEKKTEDEGFSWCLAIFQFVVFFPRFRDDKTASIWACFGEARVGTPEKRGVSGGQRFGSSGLSTWVPGWHETPSCDLKKTETDTADTACKKSDVLSSFLRMIFPWNPVVFVSGTPLIKGGKDKVFLNIYHWGAVDSRKRVSIVSCSVQEWLAAVQELCNIPFKGTYLQEPQATLHASNSWIILEIFGDFLDMLAPSFLNFRDVVCSPASVWLYILDILWSFTKNHYKFLERHPSRQGDGIGSTTFVAFCGWAHQRLRFYYLTWGAINKGLGNPHRKTSRILEVDDFLNFTLRIFPSRCVANKSESRKD